MQTSKIFGASITALSLVGAIGMAQAQTPNPYNPDGKDNTANPPNFKGSKTQSPSTTGRSKGSKAEMDKDGRDNVANPPKFKKGERSTDESKNNAFKDKDGKDNVANPPKFNDKKSSTGTMSK